ncbi:LysR family transcriptional regulator [Vibrio kyushuensis]|uniref:LysR family transcriptional regulator n=1 Tax=Vibrio TaxID=662 RepID=UPI003D0FC9C7
MDKLRALRYFKQVSEVNSFSLAALEFDVPASSISRRIKDLENDLGVELIKRSTRHVSTTELGSVYYNLISDALKKIDDADELISQRMDAMEGKLRISSTTSYGEKVLSPILQKFRKKYPLITLDLDFSDEKVVFGQDAVDIAIRAGHAPEERVIAKRISSAEFKLVASPALVSSLTERYGRSVLNIKDLEKCPTLQYRGNHGDLLWWALRDEVWEKVDITPLMRCNSAETLMNAALRDEGLALYPTWWIKDYLASGELVEVPTERPISSTRGVNLDIYILYQQAKYQIPKVKQCVDFILEQLKEAD